ncbi:hypothetical protein mRhiFer1_002956 [Rhinolophus ferrumequinum]|uniref:Claudin 34 n=1 Tax=Rhinolophus ferrumequinum TaxID=59479 RepID=A0A7J8AUC8_RHIFE|nr:claudin-34-like [Rhinolophus ferrumequinum]KAF6389816.1 hypothetical protein mRhiFer1_002956 [Rhinolophus ferrumequinum]
MRSRTTSGNCAVAGFAIATAGWILSITCMGLVDWRVWHVNSTSISERSPVCVGMWKVCIHRHVSQFHRPTFCYPYTYGDTFLPVDILVGQHLLLAASILGLLGKVCIVFALRKLSMGILGRKVISNAFAVAGILNMAAGMCILITVIWNHKSVMNGEGISFPLSFHIPLKPDRQEMGNAMLVAYLAAFLMLLSVLFHLRFQCTLPNQVQPEASEM